MIIGVLKETYPGERRVALVPISLPGLAKKKFDVLVEAGAGLAAGFTDESYRERGATIAPTREEVIQKADILAYVRAVGANPENGKADLPKYRRGQIVLGHMEPLSAVEEMKALAQTGVTSFALELIPRISRAQYMDVLSSMATVAGYKAVLLAASELPRMFPLMMTAAGTIKPAKVFVIGAGVAGLQAIGMAKKMMGAVVHAYDIRPAVKEQIESLGGKFVELPIEAGQSETKGGYAKAMDEEFYRKQRELMGKVVAESDVVITTAAVPGKKAPILVTREMVEKMHPGSVVIDLAAERGGNCDATVPGEWVEVGGARIYGPLNLPSTIPYHASQMYSTNVTNFLLNLYKKPEEGMDVKDQIVAETMSTRDGEIVNAMIREKAGLPALNTAPAAPEEKKA